MQPTPVKTPLSDLEQFAIQTLKLLERQQEWDADTVDDVGAFAMDLHLANTDEEGLFQLIGDAVINEEISKKVVSSFSVFSQELENSSNLRLHLGAARIGNAWGVHYIQDNRKFGGVYKSTLEEALAYLSRECEELGTLVDWDSCEFSAGKHIVTTTETSDGVSSHSFNSQLEFDNFRRKVLTDSYFSTNAEDTDEVERLLNAGEIDRAWAAATSDDGEKELHRTDFGAWTVEEEDNLVRLSSLPEWMRKAVVKYATNL